MASSGRAAVRMSPDEVEEFLGSQMKVQVATVNPDGSGLRSVLTGTGFTTATNVQFGSATAGFTVNSDTQITATVPAGSTGAVNVTVIESAVAFAETCPGAAGGPTGVTAGLAADSAEFPASLEAWTVNV